MERPAGSGTPCLLCPKSGDGNPHPEKELLPENRAAIAYYHLCQQDATGLLPRDLLVLETHSLIARVTHQAEQNKPDRTASILAAMFGGK